MSSSLLLQQCPACLVHLTWIVFVMTGRWPYSWCPAGSCRQDLFNIARKILVLLPSSFFSSRLVSLQVVHPYSSIDTTAAWKKLRFILSVRSDFFMIEISTLDGNFLKLVDKFTYLGSSVSSTEKDIDTRLTKAWTAIDRLSIQLIHSRKSSKVVLALHEYGVE